VIDIGTFAMLKSINLSPTLHFFLRCFSADGDQLILNAFKFSIDIGISSLSTAR
jgi:hypothetical protein